METNQILETIRMVEEENLDIRTITMGISLLIVLTPILIVPVRKFFKKLQQKRKTLSKSAKRSKVNMVFRSLTSGFRLPL